MSSNENNIASTNFGLTEEGGLMEVDTEDTGTNFNEMNTIIDNSNLNADQEITTDKENLVEDLIPTNGQQLIDFLQYLNDYKTTLPDLVTRQILNNSGFNTTDPRILRLASITSQKFIANIANDALQHCKMRTANSQNKKAPKDKRYTLLFDDLIPVLSDMGISIKKPQYYH